jgi:hypothetical protein
MLRPMRQCTHVDDLRQTSATEELRDVPIGMQCHSDDDTCTACSWRRQTLASIRALARSSGGRGPTLEGRGTEGCRRREKTDLDGSLEQSGFGEEAGLLAPWFRTAGVTITCIGCAGTLGSGDVLLAQIQQWPKRLNLD